MKCEMGRSGRHIRGCVAARTAGVLAIALALVAVGYVLVTGRAGRRPGPSDLAAGPVDAGDLSGGQAASRPTTTTRPRWTPPRFTARQDERDRMVAVIRRYGLRNEKVLKAMATVPRHGFVPARHQGRAYEDTPLPIGYGQTISQPYMVAEMTRLLKLKPSSRVLEIGTGSGYQAAVLTHFTRHVYTIEIVKPLHELARKTLKTLGYRVVKARAGDGYYGWEGQGPFDAIIVTCAAGQIPPPLIRQLGPGGRMVIPVGSPFATQWLMLVEKDRDGRVRSKALMPVAFVPMLRGSQADK